MKKGINFWSFPGGLEGTASQEACMKLAKEAGYDTFEVCAFDDGPNGFDKLTRTRCEELQSAAAKLGLEISSLASGVYWGYHLASPAETDRTRALKAGERLLEIASWLGVGALLFIPGAVDVFFDPNAPVIPYGTVEQRAREGLKKLLPVAADKKVCLALENVWNSFLQSPVEMRDFIDSFGSPWVGSYLDLGNALRYGYPEHWAETLGKRVKRVHVKDFRKAVGTAEGFVDLLEGDVNFAACLEALKGAGYDGPLTAEMIPHYKTHPLVRVQNTSRALDAILGRVPG
jgi:hexulose-6-phosphate isomerase